MKQTQKLVALFVLVLAFSFKGIGQVNRLHSFNSIINHVFDPDSLAGFDEEAAKLSALSEGFLGEEFKVRMYQLKRQYVNNKYGIAPKPNYFFNSINKVTSVAPACTNEDFEGSAAGVIATSNQVTGWTVTGGTNYLPNNSCNLGGCCPNAPSECEIISCPTAAGYIDPVIGGCYPIYSVFGTTANNGNAVNPTLPTMFGDKVIRINSSLNNYSISKLSKTFAVTANNALFQFAFISVFYPGHSCCDAGAFQIKLTNATAGTVITCPSFSVSAPSSQCATTNTSVTYFIGGGSCPPNTSSNFSPIFNKWNFNSLDLSAYIGNNITIDVIASDCTAGGHYGYVYFDAQCSPMTIIGNGNGFPAGTPNITLPTCGASGATITAPAGLGPYSWSSSQISIPGSLSIPSNTNITLVTNQSGTVQLSMNPPGSCAPITKVITVTITPAPVVLASATQANCTNTLSAASLTTAGSASVNPTITWSPAPGSVAGNSLSATGLAVGVTTITVLDNTGCQATATVNILPTPPPVTFTINNVTGSQSITCQYPNITMSTTTTYTYGAINYTWTSTSFSSTGAGTTLNSQGNYAVCGMDPATTCSFCTTFNIGQNITPPTTSVTPITQVITCSASAVTFTGTCTSPSINVMQNWYTPFVPPPGPPAASTNGTNSPFAASSGPGTYSCIVTDLTNGCTTTKTVEVTSISGFPTFSLSSANNFSVGCSPNTTTVFVVNPITTGPAQYAYLPPTFTGSNSTYIANSSTVIAMPGTWTISVYDPVNFCHTDVPVIILQNTVQPHASASLLTETLTCFNPTVLATGTSTTPGTVISWNVPSTPPTLPSTTVIVGPPVGPATGTNTMAYPDYTVVVTNTVNGCVTTSVVPISQNFLAPKPALAAISTPAFINCLSIGGQPVPVVVSFTNNPIQSGITGAVPIVTSWMGPSPSATTSGVATYSAYVPGIYTITVQDSKNGCIGVATKTIVDQTQPPVLVNLSETKPLDCATGNGTLLANVVGGNSGMTIQFTEYPSNVQFSPSNVTNTSVPIGNVLVDGPGQFEYIVTNTLTGCKTTGTFVVVNGTLTAAFDADQVKGFAPLTVNFNNNSFTSTGTTTVNSIWSYGNGIVNTTSLNTVNTTYNAPGTYTVWMYVSRGSCRDSISKVIEVEIPSKLEIPNVFTPNGDGSNDIFFLKTANLSEITATIFDRWGNKVYEVTSTTGNIAWDGKNQEGKECASGVYFYIIKASGKDSKAYEQKGNVSLYR